MTFKDLYCWVEYAEPRGVEKDKINLRPLGWGLSKFISDKNDRHDVWLTSDNWLEVESWDESYHNGDLSDYHKYTVAINKEYYKEIEASLISYYRVSYEQKFLRTLVPSPEDFVKGLK